MNGRMQSHSLENMPSNNGKGTSRTNPVAGATAAAYSGLRSTACHLPFPDQLYQTPSTTPASAKSEGRCLSIIAQG